MSDVSLELRRQLEILKQKVLRSSSKMGHFFIDGTEIDSSMVMMSSVETGPLTLHAMGGCSQVKELRIKIAPTKDFPTISPGSLFHIYDADEKLLFRGRATQVRAHFESLLIYTIVCREEPSFPEEHVVPRVEKPGSFREELFRQQVLNRKNSIKRLLQLEKKAAEQKPKRVETKKEKLRRLQKERQAKSEW